MRWADVVKGNSRGTQGRLFDGAPMAPVAVLEAAEGVARVSLTLSQESAEVRRVCDLGGGETVWVPCQGWANLSVLIESITQRAGAEAARVSLGWTDRRAPMGVGPRRFQAVTRGIPVDVPHGATRVIARTADAAFAWLNTLDGASSTIAVSAGVETRVLGDAFTPNVDNHLIWLLEL